MGLGSFEEWSSSLRPGLTSLIILRAMDIAKEPEKPVRMIGDWDLTAKLNTKIKDTTDKVVKG